MGQLTIRDRLNGPEFREEVAKILPKHVTPERMARAATTALMRTPMLAECDQASFFQAMMLLSQYGLEPDGRNAHLIPFRNNKKGIVECQLIIDYKGMVELIERSGLVSKIHADRVCENDDFEFDCGEIKHHKIDFRKPRGEAYAYYCIIEKRDGSRKCEVMTRDEVDAVRRRSKAASSGPWVTDFDEMAKKTVFKRASKWVSISAEIRELFQKEDEQLFQQRDLGRIPASPSARSLAEVLEAPRLNSKPETDYFALLDQCKTQEDFDDLHQRILADESVNAATETILAQEISDRVAVLSGE
jgi:recombination protein RecT